MTCVTWRETIKLSYTMTSRLSTSVLEEHRSSIQRQHCGKISQRLLNLECPYLEGLDQSVVKEIILSPGEARLRVLQWVIARIHPQLQEVLLSTATTATIPRLTSLLADLGMCGREDYELVQGTTSLSKQISFLEALLSLVGESRCDELSETFSNTTIRNPTSVKMEQCCGFVDNLCRQEELSEVFSSSVSLLSPAIANSISTNVKTRAPLGGSLHTTLEKKRATRTSSVPSLSELSKQVTEMNQLLEEKELELEQLSQQHPSFSHVNQTALENYHKNLSVSLGTLSQLANSFCHTYESDIQPWTSQQTSPQLSGLGPLCKRIHLHRQYVLKLLQSIGLLQSNRQRIDNLEDGTGDLLTVHNLSDVQQTLKKCLEVYTNGQSM